MTARRHPRVLPDDGIIDPVAVQVAASGTRPVALTDRVGRLTPHTQAQAEAEAGA